MSVKNNNRTAANLAMLEFAARKLGKLKDEVVFLGGCTTALFITDSVLQDVRPTLDVDCIVDVISLNHYHRLEKQLHEQGFKKSMLDDAICRWHYEDLILDVMPTDEKILGFGNRWYKAAVGCAFSHQIANDLPIKSVTAPYFLATKLEAFKQRGNDDYLSSHDFEDIITVLDGRIELVQEIANADEEIKKYLQKIFSDLLKNEKFLRALPGHLRYGALTTDRFRIILQRIEEIAQSD